LSFDLVQNVEFSAVVFKQNSEILSSVLDITYRKPVFGATFEASFLGGSLSVDAVSKNKSGLQLQAFDRNNSLLVNSQDTQTNFTPAFVDVQTNVNYQAS
jgi:hypothetical protein